MNKFWILLKIQMNLLFKGNASARANKSSAGGQIRKPLYGGKTKSAPVPGSSRRGYMPMLMASAIVILTLVVSFCLPIAEMLAPLGLLYVLPAITITASSLTVLVTTIYKTNGVLFGFKDYDLVMSLPVKTSAVIASRIAGLYLMNLVFCLFIMVPSGIIYAVYVAPAAMFYVFYILLLFFIPLIPVVIATVIGCLIAVAASHFKRKSGMSIVFTIVFMVVWMFVVMNMRTIVENFVDIGEVVVSTIGRIYPPTLWFTSAVSDLNPLYLLLFIGVSIGAFALFLVVVSKNFKKINSFITANRTTSDYKIKDLKQAAPRMALFKKEFRRLTSSSVYFLNTGIGIILLTIVSVLLLIFGSGRVMEFAGMSGMSDMSGISGILVNVAPLGMAFFLVMTCTSASSISLEGKSFWIVKSLPVTARDILMSKLWVNLALIFGAVAVNSTIFSIVFASNALEVLMMYVTPLIYGLYTAVFGLKLNLSYPDFDWDSEVKVVKQSMPTMVLVFTGMAITLVPAILTLFVGPLVLYIATAVLAVVTILLYRNVFTKGVSVFDSLPA